MKKLEKDVNSKKLRRSSYISIILAMFLVPFINFTFDYGFADSISLTIIASPLLICFFYILSNFINLIINRFNVPKKKKMTGLLYGVIINYIIQYVFLSQQEGVNGVMFFNKFILMLVISIYSLKLFHLVNEIKYKILFTNLFIIGIGMVAFPSNIIFNYLIVISFSVLSHIFYEASKDILEIEEVKN